MISTKEIESNTLDLGFGFREHAEETQSRRKIDFFAGGFGFASRDGTEGSIWFCCGWVWFCK